MKAKYPDVIASHNRGMLRFILILSGLAATLLSPGLAADIIENNILENTLDTYQTSMAGITGNIRGLLVNTFYLLAVIEFSWGMIKTYLDNGGLQTFLSEIITRIMFIGFFFYLFQVGTAIPLTIVTTFRDLATTVPDTSQLLTPDNLIDIGQGFLNQSWDVIEGGKILVGLGLLFSALIVFVAMVILAAHLTVALLEFYVVGYGGFVLLAFGASRWTHGYAVAYLKYAMSVGMKLFILLIIVAVIVIEMTAYFVAVEESSMTNVWSVTAFALFSVVLAVTAPQSVMGMMSGVSVASGAGAVAAGGAVATAASVVAGGAGLAAKAASGAVTGAIGAGSAAKAAGGLGKAAANASKGGGAASALAGTGAVAKEVGSAALSKAFPVKDSAGGKLASRMNDAKKAIQNK